MNHSAARALLCLVLVGASAGCSDPSSDDGAATAGSSAGATAGPPTSAPPRPPRTPRSNAPTPADPAGPGRGIPPFPTDETTGAARSSSGNGLGVSGVRVGRHPGFDRVVFDLDGSGSPGWRVEYVQRPVAEGSGDLVRLRGTAFLQVILLGVGMPFDTGVAPFGGTTTRISGTGTAGIAEVSPGGVFEGEQQAFVGLTGGQRPFRVLALTDPARVVVDVRDD